MLLVCNLNFEKMRMIVGALSVAFIHRSILRLLSIPNISMELGYI